MMKGVKSRPSRRPAPMTIASLSQQLPSTPEKPLADGSQYDSPCILLHGEPLNTPAKAQYTFGLIPTFDDADLTDRHPSETAGAPEQPIKMPGRKNSFQRAVDVNKMTLENTKLNSGYSQVDIVKEIVRVDIPRPPSPSSKFSAGGKKGRRRQSDRVYDIPEGSTSSSVRFTVSSGDACNEPPFYDMQFPLKPIIKKSHSDEALMAKNQMIKDKERIVVKRIIYTDDADYVDESVEADRLFKASNTTAQSPQLHKQTRLNTPARRIIR